MDKFERLIVIMREQHSCLQGENLDAYLKLEADREALAKELTDLSDPALKAELQSLTVANLGLLTKLSNEVRLEVRKLEQIKDKLVPYGSEAYETNQSFWA